VSMIHIIRVYRDVEVQRCAPETSAVDRGRLFAAHISCLQEAAQVAITQLKS
jgi:hypothetical protein